MKGKEIVTRGLKQLSKIPTRQMTTVSGLQGNRLSAVKTQLPRSQSRTFSTETKLPVDKFPTQDSKSSQKDQNPFHDMTFNIKTDKSDAQDVIIKLPSSLAKIIKDTDTLNKKVLSTDPLTIIGLVNVLDAKEKGKFFKVLEELIEANKEKLSPKSSLEELQDDLKEWKIKGEDWWNKNKYYKFKSLLPGGVVATLLATAYGLYDQYIKSTEKLTQATEKLTEYFKSKDSKTDNLTLEGKDKSKPAVEEARKIYANKKKSLVERTSAASIIAFSTYNRSTEAIKILNEIKEEIETKVGMQGTEGDITIICKKLLDEDHKLPTLYAKILNQLGRSTIGNPTSETHQFFKDAIALRDVIDSHKATTHKNGLNFDDTYNNDPNIDDTIYFQQNKFIAVALDTNSNKQELEANANNAKILKSKGEGRDEIHVNVCLLYEAISYAKIAEKSETQPQEKISQYNKALTTLFHTEDPNKIVTNIKTVTAKLVDNISKNNKLKINYYDRLLNEGSRILLEQYKLTHEDKYLKACEQVLDQIDTLKKQFPSKIHEDTTPHTENRRKEIRALKIPNPKVSSPEAKQVDNSDSKEPTR